MKTRKIWMLFAALMMAAACSYAQAARAEPDPMDPTVHADPQPLVADRIDKLIKRLRDNLEEIQNDKSIAYQISDELIVPHIDFPRVTRLVIGKYWRNASPAQKQQLVREIESLLVRSYVTAMTSYADEIATRTRGVRYFPSRFKPGDRKASVRATFVLEGGQSAEVQYQLYYRGEWKIYDIRIEGISLAITYRTSFGEQIKRDGLDNLIAQLAERNRKGEVELPRSLAPKENAKAAP